MTQSDTTTAADSRDCPAAVVGEPAQAAGPARALQPGILGRLFRPSVRQALVVIFDQGFCSVTNFLTGVLVARACTKAEYGVFVLGLTLARITVGIQYSLVSGPYTIQSPRFKGLAHAAYLGSTFLHQLVICALATLGLVASSAVVSATGGDPEMARVLMALSVASFALLMRDFIRLAMLADLRVWAALAMGLAANVATVTSMLVAYFTGSLTAPMAYLIVGCCSAVPAAVAILCHRKKLVIARRQVLSDLKKNWRLGKWLVARSPVHILAVQIYPFTLAAILGAASVGVYAACMTLAAVLNPLFMGVTSYLRPKASHAAATRPSSVRRIAYSTTLVLIAPVALFVLAIGVFGDMFLRQTLGQAYDGFGHVLIFCGLAVGAATLTGPIRASIDALGRTDVTFKSLVIAAIISITAGVPLVYAAGPLGAAAGLLASRLVAGFYLWRRLETLSQHIATQA